jgi:hypothetical protein
MLRPPHASMRHDTRRAIDNRCRRRRRHVAPDVGSGEAEHMAQAISERHARLDLDLDCSAVHFKSDWHCGSHDARAARNARSTMVPVSARR